MAGVRAELEVYCGSFFDYTSEGRFFPEKDLQRIGWEECMRNRYLEALHRVTGLLQCKTQLQEIHIENPYQVESAEDGERIVEHAETIIPGATGIVELVMHMHGMTDFIRKIVFPGATANDLERIITQLRQSRVQMWDSKVRDYKSFGMEDPEPNRPWLKRIELYSE